MSLVPTPKPIFRGVVVATTGNIDRVRKGWSDADIARFVTSWGGKFSADVDDSVTHLLALPQDVELKNRSSRVSSAMKRKRIAIVTLDWLEDSIIKRRKLPPRDHQLAHGGRSIAESSKAKRAREQKKAAKDEELGEKYVNRGLFHTYSDETNFWYDIVITRGEKGERYNVTLFESNAQPSLYHVGYIYYGKKGARAVCWRMECPQAGCAFNEAFKEFRRFFCRQTGVDWDNRVVFRKGKGKIEGRGFVYEIPTGGKPIGLVEGKVPDMDAIFDNTGSSSPSSFEIAAPDAGDDEEDSRAAVAEPAAAATTTEEVAAHDGNYDGDTENDMVMHAIDNVDDGGRSSSITPPTPSLPSMHPTITTDMPLLMLTGSAVFEDSEDSGMEERNDVVSSSSSNNNNNDEVTTTTVTRNVDDDDSGYESV